VGVEKAEAEQRRQREVFEPVGGENPTTRSLLAAVSFYDISPVDDANPVVTRLFGTERRAATRCFEFGMGSATPQLHNSWMSRYSDVIPRRGR
jgi:hypothetical protein